MLLYSIMAMIAITTLENTFNFDKILFEEQELLIYSVILVIIHAFIYFFDIRDVYEQKQLEIMQDEYLDDEQFDEELEEENSEMMITDRSSVAKQKEESEIDEDEQRYNIDHIVNEKLESKTKEEDQTEMFIKLMHSIIDFPINLIGSICICSKGNNKLAQ